MKRFILALTGGMLLLAGGWFAKSQIYPSEAARILRSLDDLAALLSYPEGEGNLAAVQRTSTAVDYFTPDVNIDINVPGVDEFRLNNRDELQHLLLAARRYSPHVNVQLLDPIVDLDVTGDSATVRLTAVASIAGINRHQDELSAMEARLQLRRTAGHWRIARAETVDTLKQ
jgi:hypothetical protein